MAAFAAGVHAHGFAEARLAEAARALGVPASTISGYWPDATACLLDTVETAAGQAFSRMAGVFLETTDDCAVAAHRALGTLLVDIAGATEMVHLAVVELPRLGPIAREPQRRLVDLFCEFLTPGFLTTDHVIPDPEIVSTSLGGGLWETVRRLALEGRLQTLPELLPTISFVCISTFFGADEAARVSRIPVEVAPWSPAVL
jgi:AcrR family transcriptional regulator